eukprot:CAMPEP_0204824726 /NCGR_PEP_ID=MMETSP1346-20131115/2717_1 /ASSEMBLY_ACC=CAM_ASM_000771 /TAXON_ID=215587 /ORGANISM="Aplanochytrium stocchinoi, Strain GSBS06" /LENGTH=425 /DNA_ID=CAMNT_0051952033 /DNA_START=106 /DNA_END=1383 /DNA_ORIENTATION=-
MTSFPFLSAEENEVWKEIINFENLNLNKGKGRRGKPSQEEIEKLRNHRTRKKEFFESLSEEKRGKLEEKKKTKQSSGNRNKDKIEDDYKKQLLALKKFAIKDQELVDIGINLHERVSYEKLSKYLERAFAAGVTRVVLTGCSVSSSLKGAQVCNKWYTSGDYLKFPVKLYHTVGIHPHDAKTLVTSDNDSVINERKWKELQDIAKSAYMVSLGECGLDYDRMFSPMEAQKLVFRKQVRVAAEMDKALFVHLRDRDSVKGPPLGALRDAAAILENQIDPKLDPSRVCIHCFTGNESELKSLSTKGYKVGFTGYLGMEKRAVATGTISALSTAANLPINQMLIETDSPFMKPDKLWFPDDVGLKKGNNEPATMPAVCRALAKVYDNGSFTEEQIAEHTTKNASEFFQFEKVDKQILSILEQPSLQVT